MLQPACRFGTTALVLAFALLTSRPALSQTGPTPGRAYYPRGRGDALVNGYAYEVENKAKAERLLRYAESRPQPNPSRVQFLRHRIAVDNWLMRKQMLCEPGSYPYWTDRCTHEAILEAQRPAAPGPPL